MLLWRMVAFLLSNGCYCMLRTYENEIGKRFIVEPSAPVLSSLERDILARVKPAGVLFRTRNFKSNCDYSEWLGTFAQLLSDVQAAIGRQKLLLCIDHEGGRIIRPPEPITRFPWCASWGDKTGAVSSAMARELRSLGLNVNFAPVADIHSNPDNPVINKRAFGTTAEVVIPCAIDSMYAFMNEGILPCAKHFPGHGDTRADTHYELPVVDRDIDELEQREFKPFRALINAGVPMIMTSHIVYSKIDDCQATISGKIINDLLRVQMNYGGVVVADAIGMAAIKESMTHADLICKGIEAGLDIFLVTGDNTKIEQVPGMFETMLNALDSESVTPEMMDASLTRIDALLERAQLHPVHELPKKVFAAHAELAHSLGADAENEFVLNLPGFE